MADQPEVWECPACAAVLDISGIGFYTRVACPQCGREEYVHTMLANFRIEGVLGVGGMSVVLRARDLVLGRPVAIKVLNDAYRDQPERIARFERECELMAKVRHGNVVPVYSAGWARGQFYIVMELINGRNLEVEVDSGGAMVPAEALEIVRQVVYGLDAAHHAGLLHRDMKPGNILIDQSGQAKVLDFGLSLETSTEDTEEIIWATPFYVPPETLMREAEDLRTDIYALGMTLRHLLTGNDQFPSSPQSARELIECKQKLAPLRHEMPHLDSSFCELVDHMTCFKPSGRPESYKQLLTEIAEVQASLAERAAGFASPRRRRRFRNAALLIFGTPALGAGLAAAVAWSLHAMQGPGCLDVPKKWQWEERAALAAADKALAAGEHEQALTLYRNLSMDEGEPAACAWAGMHAYMLQLVADGLAESPARRALQTRMLALLSATAPTSANTAFEEMQRVFRRENVSSLSLPLTRAAAACLALDDALAAGRRGDAPRLQRAAAQALRAAGADFESLARALEGLPMPAEGTADAPADAPYREPLSRFDIDGAILAIDKQMAQTQDAALQRRLGVQKEACELLREVVALLQRRKIELPQKDLTPALLRELCLLQLKTPGLPEEMAALMLVAQGDFAAAQELNPYRNRPDSREPFAVFMRDWMQRVRP